MNQQVTFTILSSDFPNKEILNYFNNNTLAALEHIKNHYPFTFIEKESIRKKVDELENNLWIKDRYGYCELINKKFADLLSTNYSQVEGNSEDIFFPVESRRIIKSLNENLYETKCTVIAKGIQFLGSENDQQYTLCNIPIIDAEDTVVAIICVTFASEQGKSINAGKIYSQNNPSPDDLPFAAAVVHADGTIKVANLKFYTLFNYERNIENIFNIKVFSPNFRHLFNELISSDSTQKLIKAYEILSEHTSIDLIILGKIFDENKKTAEIFIEILEKQLKTYDKEEQKQIGMIENLIQNNPDVVLICDKETFKFLEVNNNAITLYGYSKVEFLQMDFTDLYSAEDIQLLLESSLANFKEGMFHGPYKHRRKDGSELLVEMSRYSIRFNDRDAHFNIIRNVTAQLEDKRMNKSFKSVFENTDDLIFITDPSGFIQSTNHQVTKILGYTKNEIINSSLLSFVSDDDRNRVNLSIFRSDKRDDFLLNINIKKNDGSFLNFNFVIAPIQNNYGEIESFTLIGKLGQSYAYLETNSPVNVIDRKLSDAGKELIDARFLSDLFHDLLTPINVIAGFAQEIYENAGKTTPEQKEVYQIIQQNRAQILNSMNAAVELVSLTERGSNFLVAETKITEILDMIVEDIDEIRRAYGVEFAHGKISSSLKFETDRQRFKNFIVCLFRIVANLSGQKRIYFSAFAQDKDTFIVTFRDLHTHSSTRLMNNLQNIFSNFNDSSTKESNQTKILIVLLNKLLNFLKGRFIILCEEESKSDYGIVFPKYYNSYQADKTDHTKISAVQEDLESLQDEESNDIVNEEYCNPSKFDDLSIKSSKNNNDPEQLSAIIRDEFKLESLRAKIRKKEEERKSKIISEENINKDDELVEEKIEFIDIDLNEVSNEQVEEESVEIVETSPGKQNITEPSENNQTNEKVDIFKLSCLYFEDQIDAQILFRVQMKGMKNLDLAVSFEESLPLLESGNYDFIVIDINLQGSYNGLDILRILRTMPKYENTPVFAVTAYMLPGDQHKFVLAGFNRFISKPIFRDQMIDLLAEVFNPAKQS